MARMTTVSSARAFINTADEGKDTPARDKPPARQITQQLINSRRFQRAGNDAARAAAAACDHLYQDLSRWVGLDGCHTLFTRALAEARIDHPLLEEILLRPRSEPYVEGVTETIDAYGAAQTAEALESMLVRMVELLGRLIGDDMVMKLIQLTLSESQHDDANRANTREEA
jgi:hypothetical protein